MFDKLSGGCFDRILTVILYEGEQLVIGFVTIAHHLYVRRFVLFAHLYHNAVVVTARTHIFYAIGNDGQYIECGMPAIHFAESPGIGFFVILEMIFLKLLLVELKVLGVRKFLCMNAKCHAPNENQ